MRRNFSTLCMTAFLFAVAGSALAQTDVTSTYIKNANLSSLDGWTAVTFINPEKGNNTEGYACEAYAGWGNVDNPTYSLKQTITLPAGNYELVNYSFFRYGVSYNTDATKSLAKLYAGSDSVAIKTLGSIKATGYANSKVGGANVFDSYMYRNVLDFKVEADNTEIEIGIDGTFDLKQSWCIAGKFQLLNMDEAPASQDVTYLLTNSGFEYGDMTGWTLSETDALKTQSNPSFESKSGTYYAEKWIQSGSLSDRSMSQTLSNLPSGKYTVTAYVKYGGTGAYISAGDNTTQITAGNEGKYEVSANVTSDDGKSGTLTISAGVKDGTSNWVCFDRFGLSYVSSTISEEAAKKLISDAEALYESPMNSTVLGTLKSAATTLGSSRTSDNYEALQTAIKNAQTSIDNYATAKTYLDAASKLDETGKASYAANATVKDIQTAYANKTLEAVTTEQETAIAEALRTAAKVQTTKGADMTLAIVNPDFETGNITGWTTANSGDTGARSTSSTTYAMTNSSGAYLFNTWSVGTPVTQTVTGLNPGKYTVKAIMATDANKTLVLTLNGTEVTAASVDKGTGVEITNADVVVANGSLTISAGTSDKYWYKADNFTLTFVEPVTVQKATLTEESGLTPLTDLAGKPVDVSFTRNFTEGVSSTVCLPYEITPETSAGKFYAFKGVSEKDGVYTVTMSETATTLAANTPYLFVPAATGDVTFTGTVAEAAATYTPTDVTEGEWTFVGTYSKVTYDAEDKWGDYAAIYGFVAKNLDEAQTFKAGEFVKMKKPGSSYTPAFRAVMKYKQATDGGADANVRRSVTIPSSLNVVLENEDGTTTAIGTVDVDTDYADGAWYTIDGRKIQGKPTAKGIYINGGQKVLIK